MHRFWLMLLRFSLSAWVGIAIFFVMVILDLRNSELFDRISKFNHPKVLFPLYYGFEFALLGPAVVCAVAGLLNADRCSLWWRYAIAGFAAVAFGLALFDYMFVYRKLVEILADPTAIPAAKFVELHQASRRLNEVILGASIVAAVLALWPEKANGSPPVARPAE